VHNQGNHLPLHTTNHLPRLSAHALYHTTVVGACPYHTTVVGAYPVPHNGCRGRPPCLPYSTQIKKLKWKMFFLMNKKIPLTAEHEPVNHTLQAVVTLSSCCVCLLGLEIIYGCITHNQLRPTWAPMQFNTALGFVLSAIGLWSMTQGNAPPCLAVDFPIILPRVKN